MWELFLWLLSPRDNKEEDSALELMIRIAVSLFFIVAGIINTLLIFDDKKLIPFLVLLSPIYFFALYIFIDTIVYEYKRDKELKAKEDEKL